MNQKHYQNDYKRLLGIDESRTASEKLLDRDLAKRSQNLAHKMPVQDHEKIDQPQKKVKREASETQKSLEPQQIVAKVIRAIRDQTEIKKIKKGLGVLRKCFNSEGFGQKLNEAICEELADVLFQLQNTHRSSLMETIELNTEKIQILAYLKESVQPLSKYLHLRISIKILFLKLITDDSFSFNKNLISLKETVFKEYTIMKEGQPAEKQKEGEENQEKQSKNDEMRKNKKFMSEQIMKKLLKLPNLNIEWVKIAIISFIKSFIVEFKELLEDPKSFLQEYNKLCKKRKQDNHNSSSYDFMGSNNANNGGSFTVVEQQDGSNAWCQRQ